MIVVMLVGVIAGIAAGLMGIGGGIVFVPALTIGVGLSHLEAEATSLLAIIPVALVGSWRQLRYGNLHLRDAAVIGALSVVGAVAGVALANVLPERVLRIGFALLMLHLSVRLARSGIEARRRRLAAPTR